MLSVTPNNILALFFSSELYFHTVTHINLLRLQFLSNKYHFISQFFVAQIISIFTFFRIQISLSPFQNIISLPRFSHLECFGAEILSVSNFFDQKFHWFSFRVTISEKFHSSSIFHFRLLLDSWLMKIISALKIWYFLNSKIPGKSKLSQMSLYPKFFQNQFSNLYKIQFLIQNDHICARAIKIFLGISRIMASKIKICYIFSEYDVAKFSPKFSD